ncbi:hypothetical protein LTR27_001803 [Elasticomyces elasticus]|nr:hypothetical protein LTR27_001803 [Elasticomyces elasticus]
MSGVAEAATVYSLVTGTIEIIKTAIEIWEAVKDKDKLPRQPRVVAEKLPSIQQLLATSEQQYQLMRLPDTKWATARQNVERCRTGCEDIRGIFDKAFPSNANAVQRVWTGTVTVLSGRGKKAEELLQDVYKELEVLGQYHIVTNTELLAQIGAAVKELKGGEKPTYHHSGSGALSVHTGTGPQYTNSGEGHMFNGLVSHPSFYSVHHHGQSEDRVHPKAIRQRFLDSLWFPEIDQRHHEVKTACPNTFEWIFTEAPPDHNQKPEKPWASFASWLCSSSNESMYWISGKAGSGKSTLMAHLMRDRRTVEALESWANRCELLRLDYFFWRPGTEMQTSIEGLLRTIAFQLCKHVPTAVDTIMRGSQYGGEHVPSWTERTLVSAIKIAIQVAESSRQYISIFIDGLDEFLGEHEELVDLIFELQAFKNVKCCVASRPEPTLNERLKHYPHLRLQDLNRSDIDSFVVARLTPLSRPFYNMSSVHKAIVAGAEGVFLWAVLITQSVIQGIRSGDCHAILLKRIDKLPKKLEDLFARLVENIEPYNRRSLAFYVRCVTCYSGAHTVALRDSGRRQPDITLLTAAQLSHPIESYTGFAERCRQTELQVIGHCAGLLEIKHVFGESSCPNQEKRWKASDAKFLVPALLGERSSMRYDPGRRQSCREPYPYPEILYHGSRFVGWIHRSAYDYLFPTDGQPSPIEIDNDYTEVLKLMAQTALELWKIMPSFATVHLGLGYDKQHEAGMKNIIALCAELAYSGDLHGAECVMDVLHKHVSCLDPMDMPSELKHYGPVVGNPAGIFWFSVLKGYPDYLNVRFDRMIADLPGLTQLTSMLREIVNSFKPAKVDDQGVALFREHEGGWSPCIWRERSFLSSPALLRLRLLEVICQRTRLLDAGMSNDQNGCKTFLRDPKSLFVPSIAVKCIPSMIQLDLNSKEEPDFFLDLVEVMWHIMILPDIATDSAFESYGPDGPELNRDTTECLWSLFTAVKASLYTGISSEKQKPWPYESLPEYRMMFRVPWKLILLSPGARYPRMFIDVASESRTLIPLDLSILCTPDTIDHVLESGDSIEFHLCTDTAKTLASMLAWDDGGGDRVLPYLYGSDEESDNLVKSISEDIRANKQGLNLLQQLTMLAHVDHCLKALRIDAPLMIEGVTF